MAAADIPRDTDCNLTAFFSSPPMQRTHSWILDASAEMPIYATSMLLAGGVCVNSVALYRVSCQLATETKRRHSTASIRRTTGKQGKSHQKNSTHCCLLIHLFAANLLLLLTHGCWGLAVNVNAASFYAVLLTNNVFVCKGSHMLLLFSVSLSSNLAVSVAVERAVCVRRLCRSQKSRVDFAPLMNNQSKAFRLAACAWLGAGLCAVLQIGVMDLHQVPLCNASFAMCSSPPKSTGGRAWELCCLIVIFALPLGIILTCYGYIASRLLNLANRPYSTGLAGLAPPNAPKSSCVAHSISGRLLGSIYGSTSTAQPAAANSSDPSPPAEVCTASEGGRHFVTKAVISPRSGNRQVSNPRHLRNTVSMLSIGDAPRSTARTRTTPVTKTPPPLNRKMTSPAFGATAVRDAPIRRKLTTDCLYACSYELLKRTTVPDIAKQKHSIAGKCLSDPRKPSTVHRICRQTTPTSSGVKKRVMERKITADFTFQQMSVERNSSLEMSYSFHQTKEPKKSFTMHNVAKRKCGAVMFQRDVLSVTSACNSPTGSGRNPSIRLATGDSFGSMSSPRASSTSTVSSISRPIATTWRRRMRRRLISTVLAVVVCCMACWLPHCVVTIATILTDANNDDGRKDWWSSCLVLFHVAFSPVLYDIWWRD